MTPQQIHLVRSTFATVVRDSAVLPASFYRRLFERDPTLRPMFRGDLGAQGRKLVQAIGMVVGALERFETLEPVLRDLGRRHALYGVCDHHYDEVAAALLATLADGLGDRFTPAVRDAWARAYALVAAAMKSGAHVLQQSPPARHVDETASAQPVLAPLTRARIDAVTLHQLARNERSRLIGDLIARAAAAVSAKASRALPALAPRSAKHRARGDVV